ncbi:MAG: FAD-dependent oxidoreductase [Candidatus Omnitrophota bacterium]
MEERIYDVIIAGAGPAGITASIYAVRKGLSTLVLTGDIGGQTGWTGDIENYIGYQFISGAELVMKFEEHMKKYNVDVREKEKVVKVKRENGVIYVDTADGRYQARTVIIASGKKSKELGVPGEKEFRARGIAYCATCDAPLFAGKNVAVVGGGNSALEAALQLFRIAKKVYVINIAPELGGDAVMRDKIVREKNVTVMNDSRVTAILGDRFVNEIGVESGGEAKSIPIEGVFVEIGLIPNTEFESDIEKNESGEIKVNCYNETSVGGIFAAGDVTNVPEKQIIIAAGEGAKATLSAYRYLAKRVGT